MLLSPELRPLIIFRAPRLLIGSFKPLQAVMHARWLNPDSIPRIVGSLDPHKPPRDEPGHVLPENGSTVHAYYEI